MKTFAKRSDATFRVISRAFLFLVIAGSAVTGQDKRDEPLRLIHADVLRRETVGSQVLQKLEGNVKFVQGKTTILCDVASQLVVEHEYALIGHVKVFDEEQTLFADTVYIYEELQQEVAIGNVVRLSGDDSTSADRMTFFEGEDRLFSQGHVQIRNVTDRTRLTGGTAEYYRAKDFGVITESPVLFLYDSLNVETTRVSADTMRIFQESKLTTASGNVRITQKDVVATCGFAQFFKQEDRIVMVKTPQVEVETRTISGDSLELFFEDSQINRATVVGHAAVVSDADSLSPGRWQNRSTGNRMLFTFAGEELQRVVIAEQATSLYHVVENREYKGENEISGDEIIIEFSNGEAKQVLVKSDPDVAEGKFSPPRN